MRVCQRRCTTTLMRFTGCSRPKRVFRSLTRCADQQLRVGRHESSGIDVVLQSKYNGLEFLKIELEKRLEGQPLLRAGNQSPDATTRGCLSKLFSAFFA